MNWAAYAHGIPGREEKFIESFGPKTWMGVTLGELGEGTRYR
jgi:hypothetical protein